jgi:hypothetical protein
MSSSVALDVLRGVKSTKVRTELWDNLTAFAAAKKVDKTTLERLIHHLVFTNLLIEDTRRSEGLYANVSSVLRVRRFAPQRASDSCGISPRALCRRRVQGSGLSGACRAWGWGWGWGSSWRIQVNERLAGDVFAGRKRVHLACLVRTPKKRAAPEARKPAAKKKAKVSALSGRGWGVGRSAASIDQQSSPACPRPAPPAALAPPCGCQALLHAVVSLHEQCSLPCPDPTPSPIASRCPARTQNHEASPFGSFS